MDLTKFAPPTSTVNTAGDNDRRENVGTNNNNVGQERVEEMLRKLLNELNN